MPANAQRRRRHRFNPWVRKIPWRRKWQPSPVFSPGKFHGQRSLVISSPYCKESDTTEHTWAGQTWPVNQNLHLNKVSRRLLCTLNFEKRCPKGPNQLLRTPKLWEHVFLPKVKEITDLVNRPMKVKVSQSCPALCNPMDYTVHGIL